MELLLNEQLKNLRAENDDFTDYFRNTIIPQLFIDKNLILRKFSPAAMKQFNLTPDSYNSSISDITNNLRYPSIIKNIKWVMATSRILEKEIQTTDLCWYQMNIIPYFKGKDNEPNGVIVTFIDITNRIKDLKEQEKLIAEYETLLDTIAHDIKNRLTSMTLSIQMLKESDFDDHEEVRMDLDSLDRGVNKINLIIGELFASRNQKYKYEAVDELLNIEHILEDVKLALIKEIANTNTSINLDIGCSEIMFPRRQLRSIIYNLVSNSIKYRSLDRNLKISIKTIQEDDYFIISVKDNGVGIESVKQKKIFSKFYRIADTIEGSGIGLHLVKTLVTNAGGKIELESEFGEGSEFKIYLKTKCKDVFKPI
ncbi:ATP-binding protein [Algoriphagus sp.]|uniref:sensor histidine kinase n=1 Tax=Algoriphagus sp. TaxID=1872435 RepID=UPI00391A547B